jgi:hypothetical protein
LSAAAVELARGYLGSTAVTADAWDALGTALTNRDSLTVLNELVTAGCAAAAGAERPSDGSVTARRQQAGEKLKVYLDYLQPDRSSAAEVALRLFDLAAAQRAMLPVDVSVDQPVEFIQVSSDTRTLLDPNRRTAQDKLTGEQLHHFGAFYKRSWRANDWMWGRLDGAGWLVHLLLDPRRLKTITEQAGTPARIRSRPTSQSGNPPPPGSSASS